MVNKSTCKYVLPNAQIWILQSRRDFSTTNHTSLRVNKSTCKYVIRNVYCYISLLLYPVLPGWALPTFGRGRLKWGWRCARWSGGKGPEPESEEVSSSRWLWWSSCRSEEVCPGSARWSWNKYICNTGGIVRFEKIEFLSLYSHFPHIMDIFCISYLFGKTFTTVQNQFRKMLEQGRPLIFKFKNGLYYFFDKILEFFTQLNYFNNNLLAS